MKNLISPAVKLRNKGFTIVELLIATAVFSFILLVVTTGIIRLGNMYYKGVISSRTQESIRNIVSETSSAIQFAQSSKVLNSNVVQSANNGSFCFGDTRYTYFLDSKYTKGLESTSGLYAEELQPGSACNSGSDRVVRAKQMLGQNMRLLVFTVDSVSGSSDKMWRVSVKVAYGDNDLLTHYDNSGNALPNPNLTDVRCKSGVAGSSFCSTAQLDTIIKKRLNNT